jgi:hypothetical protein
MKTKVVLLLLCLVVLTLTHAVPMAKSSSSSSALTSAIEYWFVAHLGEMDDEGRLLVWEGTIDGDITGTMKWWFGWSPPDGVYLGGWVAYYTARWEIWDGEELLLAGESAGKTVFPDGADGMWDGHGVVTEASKGFNPLKGRKVYETGPVLMGSDPPVSFSGAGMFVIY